MSKPGSKYFKGRIYQGERVLHYIIWDGVRDYRNEPPLKIIAARFEGAALHVKVDAQAIEDIDDLHALLAAPLDGCPDCGSQIKGEGHPRWSHRPTLNRPRSYLADLMGRAGMRKRHDFCHLCCHPFDDEVRRAPMLFDSAAAR